MTKKIIKLDPALKLHEVFFLPSVELSGDANTQSIAERVKILLSSHTGWDAREFRFNSVERDSKNAGLVVQPYTVVNYKGNLLSAHYGGGLDALSDRNDEVIEFSPNPLVMSYEGCYFEQLTSITRLNSGDRRYVVKLTLPGDQILSYSHKVLNEDFLALLESIMPK